MPIPLTCPNTLDGSRNAPATFFKPWQNFFDSSPRLHVAFCSFSNSGDKLPMLAINVVAVACKGRKGFALTAAIASYVLRSPLQVSNASENAQGRPDFR